jgi:hypothetical protein
MPVFNTDIKKDDKGIGKIHLDDTPTEQSATTPVVVPQTSPQGKKKKTIIIAAAGGAALLGLAGIFALSSGKSEPPKAPQQQVQTVPVAPPVKAPVVTYTQAQSIQAKEASIYRDDTLAHYIGNTRTEAYIAGNGEEVRAGRDFAVHAGLFNKGGISVLVAAGPYAGTRITFLPVRAGSPLVALDKLGTEIASGGRTALYKTLPAAERARAMDFLRAPQLQGSGVSAPVSGREFVKRTQENGRTATAFTLTGSPEVDGVFAVKIWNGDTYNVNLRTNEYSVHSVFLFRPNYQEEFKATGAKVSRKDIPVINGALSPALARTPKAPTP